MAKHYPHPRLPGRAVVVQLQVYTTPDRYLEPLSIMRAEQTGDLAGLILRLRAVYQLEADPPKLIQAMVEVEEEFRIGTRVFDHARHLGLPEVGQDTAGLFHFEDYESRYRAGVLWLDRGHGLEAKGVWQGAFELRAEPDAEARASVADIPNDWAEALKALVRRI